MSTSRLLLVATLLLLPLAPGCTSDAERRSAHLARADQYLEEGNDREALLELRNALRLAPDDAETNFRIAQALHRQGRLGDAVFYYRETTRLDPTNSEAALAEAFLLLGESPPERSEELIEGVLAREPSNVMGHIRRSELALVLVDVDGALASALTAKEIEPEHARAHLQLGLVYRAMISDAQQRGLDVDPELYPKAIGYYERAIELAGPEDGVIQTRARLERAEVLRAWPGHREEASAAFREAAAYALEHDEEAALPALQATARFARRRDAELERWALERIVELRPGRMGAWARLAALVDDEGGDPEAVWKQLFERAPDDANAHVEYAEDLARRNLHPKAIEHLDAQLEQTSEPGTIAVALVEILIARGRLADARGVLERLDGIDRETSGRDLVAALVALAERRIDDALALAQGEAAREDSSTAQRVLAEAELRRGNTEAAAAAAERALELAGSFPPIALLRLRARVALTMGDWEPAVRFYQRAYLAAGRSWSDPDRTGLGRALYGAGRDEQARKVLEPLVEREYPWMPAVFLFAAREGARDPDAVRALLGRVLEQRPEAVQVRLALARLELQHGNSEAARAQLEAAVEANPESAELRVARARLHLRLRELDAAEADARRALELDPELGAATELLAGLLAASGRAGQALAQLEKGEAEGTLSPSGRVLLGSLLLRLGELDRAGEMFEKIHAQHPNLPGVKNDYALVLVRQGRDLDRALELAREAQQLAPESAPVADTLGAAYLAKGLHDAARSQLVFAAELAEKRGQELPTIHYHLGLALKGLGRSQEAAQAFGRALASSVEFPEAEEARRELDALQGGTPPAADAS